jgi:hypothetical protein
MEQILLMSYLVGVAYHALTQEESSLLACESPLRSKLVLTDTCMYK